MVEVYMAPILNIFKQSNETLNQDQSRDLFIICHYQAFKQELIFLCIINFITTLIVL
jgi:hypothetical protein